jgi:8-oxo-dGTP pyrophosphatase MutT (NUDIX family)
MDQGARFEETFAGGLHEDGHEIQGSGAMNSTSLVIPFHRLPPGYISTLQGTPDSPVSPQPAATLALLKGTPDNLEVLLMKRGDQTRFLPGAYVFPGGRVDGADIMLGAVAFRVTALRETFEETGILLPAGELASLSIPMKGEKEGSRLRRALLKGECSFDEVLQELRLTVGPERLTPIGHWVTPIQEAYRYDTRFFGLEVPDECSAYPDGTELVEARWVTPSKALRLNREGRLPMIFPTLHTLQALTAFSTPREALDTLGKRNIPRLLPQVEETKDGIRMTLGPPVKGSEL